MKTLTVFLIAMGLCLSMSSCGMYRWFTRSSPESEVLYDNNAREYYAGETDGYASPNEVLDIRKKQNDINTIADLNLELVNAVKNGKISQADSIRRIIQDIKHPPRPRPNFDNSYNSYNNYQPNIIQAPSVKLLVENRTSNQYIEINSGPLAGIKLGPGESTKETLEIPIGILVLRYKAITVNSNDIYTGQSNVYIPAGRTNPIVLGQ